MNQSPYDEMDTRWLVDSAVLKDNELEAMRAQQEIMRLTINQLISEKEKAIEAVNKAVRAIYRMVELVKDTPVTHAQREGQLLLLLAFIDKCWPGRHRDFSGGDDTSDIPF